MNIPSDWENRDFYLILGVEPDATPESIKAEYLWNAKKFHPDLNNGDKRASDRFQKIQRAYEVLSDPETRRLYDEFLGATQTVKDTNGFSTPSGEETKHESQASTIPSEVRSGKYRVGVAAVGVVVAVIVGISALANAANSTSRENATGTAMPASTPSPVQPPTQAPVVSKYTADDIQACKDFREFDHGEKYALPTTVGEQRWLFNQLALDYSGFFYLADDYELQLLSNDLSRKAGLVAGMADIGDESTWGMVTTGFQDSHNRLWAVCGEVR